MSARTARRWRVPVRAGIAAAFVGMVLTVTSAPLGAAPSAEVPPFRAPVVDTAGVVPAGVERSVDAALEDYRRRSGHQVAVAVIDTTGDRSLEDYTTDLARAWGVGTKGRDDGVVLLVAVRDRRVRIDVGRGLEGRLTDLEAGRIIDERLVPLLATGRYGTAVQQGTDAIRTALGDRRVGALPAAPQPVTTAPTTNVMTLLVPLLVGVFFLTALFGRRRRRRRWGGMGVPIIWGGGYGGGGFAGGGLGGGGGFGGGGGGGFGGGGASGGW